MICSVKPPTVPTRSVSGVTSSRKLACPSRGAASRSACAWMRRAQRHHLVGVDALMRLLLEVVAHRVADDGQPGGAADQDDRVDVGGGHPRALQRLVAHLEGALHQVHHHPVELVLRRASGARSSTSPSGDWQMPGHVDVGGAVAPHVDLRPLARLLEHLQAVLVLAQVEAVLGEEVLGEPGHDPVVEVVAAEVGVAGGGEHLEDVLADLQDRHVEGAAAQVVDADLLVDVLAEAVGQRRRGRLVDDAQHLEAGDAAGVLGGLALVVVEVGGAR